MIAPSGRDTGPAGGRRDWRRWLIGVLLGTTLGDAAVNILSGDYRWRFVVVVTAVGLMASVLVQLGRYPERSSLVVWAARLLLAGSVTATVVAAFASSTAVIGWAIAAAGLLSISGVFIPVDPVTRLILASGVALIALGVAGIGIAAAWLAGSNRAGGIVTIAGNATVVWGGAAVLARAWRLGGAAVIAAGVSMVVGGGALIAGGHPGRGTAAVFLGGHTWWGWCCGVRR